MSKPQITLLICTHNGERTIQQALEAIANQTDIPSDLFEVLVINNASSDHTSTIATAAIERLSLNGRVLLEPRIGKINAFLRGVQEARGELISIIDDDNFIEHGFIRYSLEIFDQYPNVGIAGSKNSLLTDQPIPDWFNLASSRYACSQPSLFDTEEHLNGVIIANFAIIPGAGSTMRIKPLLKCLERGYVFFNDTQRGIRMRVTGEDLELCWLMYSLGYQFAFDPRIQIHHAIDTKRLTWKNFEILCKTQGAGSLGADPFIFTHKYDGKRWPLKWTWQWQLLSKLRRYFLAIFLPENGYKTDEERLFRSRVSRIHCRGEIERIIFERHKYTAHIQQVATGKWAELRVR